MAEIMLPLSLSHMQMEDTLIRYALSLSLRLCGVLATRAHGATYMADSLTQILSVTVDRVELLTCARSAILKSDKLKFGRSLST